VLSHPGNRRRALRRSYLMDRRFHGAVGPGTVRPHIPGRWGWPGYAPNYYRGRYPTGGVGQPYPAWGATSTAPGVTGPEAGLYPPCPRCEAIAGPAPAPAYCRCCGQLLR
jgi:hypothetical protein